MRVLFIFFLLITQVAFSQTKQVQGYVSDRSELSGKLFNKQTGELLSDEEIQKLRAEIPNFRYEPVYDVSGKIEKYLFDPQDPQKVIRRNPELQPKTGEKFPDFIFQTVKGKEVTNASLQGKWALLYFKNSVQTLNKPQFDQLISDLNQVSDQFEIEALAIFAYDESIESLVENSKLDGVKSGNGFFQRFHLISMPTTFLINPEGKVEAKFEGINPIDFIPFLEKQMN
jgi:peroxiredoxin